MIIIIRWSYQGGGEIGFASSDGAGFSSGVWAGRLCSEFGFHVGETVSKEGLRALLDNINPRSGYLLVEKALKLQVGYIVQIYAPPTASKKAVKDSRLFQAHKDCVAQSVQFLEASIGRTQKSLFSRITIPTGEMVASVYHHLETIQAPQMRTSILIPNVTTGPRGFESIDIRLLEKMSVAADRTYRLALAAAAKALGYDAGDIRP